MRPERRDSFKVAQLVRGRARPVPGLPGFQPRGLPRPSQGVFLGVLRPISGTTRWMQAFASLGGSVMPGAARLSRPPYPWAVRHTFWQFRHENPGTRVGGPPPEGLPGFNSGVMLLDLEAMRRSLLYGRLLEPAQVQRLADKYHFRGHLGDQDFFTMIGMEHPELFHVLDCTWNRQLCTWWRDHGYSDVFEAYFRCEGHVKIYHGNCNTPIPDA